MFKNSIPVILLIVIATALFAADKDFKKDVLEYRFEKDKYIREAGRSPMPKELLKDFKGLKYYDADPAYRFEVKIIEFKNKKDITMTTSKGKTRKGKLFGYFPLEIKGKKFKLHAYTLGSPDYLFIPFRDKTSGKATYGAGRYLDVELSKDGNYVIDFNYSYNPYCAYNEKYSCPIPPAENNLPVEIKAGELKYKKH